MTLETGRLDQLVDGVLAGQRRALARALTWIEDGTPEQLRGIVAGLYPHTGSARVLGVTGSPGVGKSTLTNAVAAELRRRGRTVAILAVDPSSPFSGGALLGDRVRMQGHHADDGVYIRSMAARGHLGGLSFATPQAALVLDAAGFDDVIVETVGVGQSEVEIAASADTTLVALAPGMGDSIQAAKAGILEVADLFVINKADQGGAGKLESEIRGMLEMGHAVGGVAERASASTHTAEEVGGVAERASASTHTAEEVGGVAERASASTHTAEETGGVGEVEDGQAWWPPILRTVAVRDEGVPELVDTLGEHRRHLEDTGRIAERHRHRAVHAVREIALERVRARFHLLGHADDPLLEALAARVAARELDPYAAADELLAAMDER